MRLALLGVIALAAAVSGFAPQEPSPSVGAGAGADSVQTPQAQDIRGVAAGEVPAGGTVISGLPRRAPEPRTMKAQWPVFTLLAASWIGIVAYLLVIGRRSRRLAELVDRTGGAS